MRRLLAPALTLSLMLTPVTFGCDPDATAPAPQAAPGTADGPSEGPVEPTAPAGTAPEGPASKPSSAPPSADTNILARADGVVITADAVAARLAQLGESSRITPDVATVRTLTEHLLVTAVAARAARAEGLAEADGATDDDALANLYLEGSAGAGATPPTEDQIAEFWAERRRVAVIVVPSRPEGSALQERILEAIETAPERALTIFADFRSRHHAGQPAEAASSPPISVRGRTRDGRMAVPAKIAAGAFALDDVGAVSPPVDFEEDRWALIQLISVEEGVAPAALTEEQREEARRAIGEWQRQAATAATLDRLRRGSNATLDVAAIQALSERLMAAGGPATRRGDRGDRLRDMRELRLRGLRGGERLPELSRGQEQLREHLKAQDPAEIQRKMRPRQPEGSP